MTVDSVAYSARKKILAVKGITESKATRIMDEALKLVDVGFQTASVYQEVRSPVLTYSTCSAELDTLLGGGIERDRSRRPVRRNCDTR